MADKQRRIIVLSGSASMWACGAFAYCKSAGKRENYISVKASEANCSVMEPPPYLWWWCGREIIHYLSLGYFSSRGVLQFSDKSLSVCKHHTHFSPPPCIFSPLCSFWKMAKAQTVHSHMLRESKWAQDRPKVLFLLNYWPWQGKVGQWGEMLNLMNHEYKLQN